MEPEVAVTHAAKKLIQDFSGRTLLKIASAYTAGIACGVIWYYNQNLIYLCGAVFLLTLLFMSRHIKWSPFQLLTGFLVFAAGLLACLYSISPERAGLPEYAGELLYLEGTVIEEPQFGDGYAEYILQVETVETGEGRSTLSGKILVRIYGHGEKNYWFGERLRLRGTIVEPRGIRNPGGFDYRLYLLSRGIEGLVYPLPAQVDSIGPGNVGRLAESAFTVRTQMTGQIINTLPSPAAELLVAILFGYKEQLPEEVAHSFRRAGVGHLMAVSGLHVGFVALLILGLFRALKLQGYIPAVLAIILVLAYAYLTGMRPSALRAALMISAALAAAIL